MKSHIKIRNILKSMLFLLHEKKQQSFYKLICKKAKISNTPVEGEKEWLEKWRRFDKHVNPIYYRVFSHYIGNDINIVPESVCHSYLETLLDPLRYVGYYSDKNIMDKIFPKGFFPETILRKMGGNLLDANYQPVSLDDDNLQEILAPYEAVILKPSVDSGSGRGILKFAKADSWKQMGGGGKPLSVSYLRDFDEDFILQPCVEQSAYISQFNPTSVNTIRMAIYRSFEDNKGHLTGAIMRIGHKGSYLDNAHAGGCYIGIKKDGSLCHEVMDQYGVSQKVFNGIDFSQDFSIPNYQEVVKFGESIADYIPHCRLLALDIVLDKENKPHLIEINIDSFSMWLFQFTVATAFGKYTDEIIDYCLKNKDKIEYPIYL